MIATDDSSRCQTCRGIHPGCECPIELAKRPKRIITNEEDRETRAFLNRAMGRRR